jgi:uncharacterized membrane protein YvbJ
VAKPKEPDFVCPNCGADVPGGAKSCPECGSDERTGWSEDTYLDGVSLPDEDDDPTEAETKSSGILDSGKILWIVVAAVLIVLWAIQSWPRG